MPVNESRSRPSLRWRGAFLLLACLLLSICSHRSKLEGHFCMHEDAPLLLRQTHISHISVPLTEASRH
jgi:hypothetical protein